MPRAVIREKCLYDLVIRLIESVRFCALAAALAASMWSGAAQSAVEIVNVPIGQIPTFDSRVTTLGGTVIQTAVVDGVGVYNYTDANGNPADENAVRTWVGTLFGG